MLVLTTMSCSICLETCNVPFTSTKCDHTFCNTCILEWMLQHDTCPLCRINIGEPSNVEEEEEEEETIPTYQLSINGQYYEDEYNMLASIICDYINSEDNEPYYKWKETNNGSSFTTIRKGNMYIDLKIDLYYIDESNDHKLKIYINRRNIIKYNKKRYNYNSNNRKTHYFCK